MFSTENIISDGFYGCCVVTCTLCAFISLVWLREQILRGGGPEWLEQHLQLHNAVAQLPDARQAHNQDNNDANDEEVNDNNNDEGIGDEDDDEDIEERFDEPNNAHENVGALIEQNQNDLQVANNNLNAANAAANAPIDAAAAQDWNPAVEWDRAAEELTWERVIIVFSKPLLDFFQIQVFRVSLK
jgi:E3 ubiquitin-protein ligase MARCH6